MTELSPNSAGLPRSSELLAPEESALLIVDLQEKLVPHIREQGTIVWNCRRLLDAASLFEVAVAGTEQYPTGLGETLPEIRSRLVTGPVAQKMAFSSAACGGIMRDWLDAGRFRVVVAGIEAHVCVLQTVYDLMSFGLQVFVPIDAVGSRHAHDEEIAFRRMESAGATLTTVETTMFEWCRTAEAAAFKELSQLVKETPPEP